MKKRESFLLKGHICYSNEQGKLLVKPDSYAVCREGICQGVFKEIPEAFADSVIPEYSFPSVAAQTNHFFFADNGFAVPVSS